MPAPSFEVIYKFGDNLVTAFVAVLEADTTPLVACGPRESATLPKERIDVVGVGFVKASEQMAKDAAGNFHDSHFAGQLVCTIITPRSTAAAAHGTRVGRVTYLASRAAQKFTAINLPYYEILSTDLAGSSSEYNEQDATDRTELVFNVELNVLGTAFPTS